VDHTAIRQYLSPLRHLRRLAFCGDTYSLRPNSSDTIRYYIETVATEDDLGYTGVPFDDIPSHARRLMLDPKLGKPYWEKRHQEKMIAERKAYMDVFPNLGWIYVGERAMAIHESDGGMSPRRVASINEMARDGSFLSSMFGI
jgi:hypothetical protein